MQNARDELLTAIGALSQLRYEVMTNKEAAPLRDALPDVDSWNNQLKGMKDAGDPLTWYGSSWLWMECYMYRRMVEAVAKQLVFLYHLSGQYFSLELCCTNSTGIRPA